MGVDLSSDLIKDSSTSIISFDNVPKKYLRIEEYFKIVQCAGKYKHTGLCIYCIYSYKCPFKRVLTCDKVARGKLRSHKKLTFQREFLKDKNLKEENNL